MKAYVSQLQASPLFAGISEEDIMKICKCFNAQTKVLAKGTFIFRAGDDVRDVYLIIAGSMHIIDEDFFGNRSIIETMYNNTLFGEAYALSNSPKHLVSVVAAEDSVVLAMEPSGLYEACTQACKCHTKMISNTMRILSEKIVRLTQKQEHIMKRTIREKLYSYLAKCAIQAHNRSFDIPYSRQQLADYLCVERSALSHELSKMRDSGLIKYRKNHFEVLVPYLDNV